MQSGSAGKLAVRAVGWKTWQSVCDEMRWNTSALLRWSALLLRLLPEAEQLQLLLTVWILQPDKICTT